MYTVQKYYHLLLKWYYRIGILQEQTLNLQQETVHLFSHLIFSNCEMYTNTIVLAKSTESIIVLFNIIKLEHLNLPIILLLHHLLSLHEQI